MTDAATPVSLRRHDAWNILGNPIFRRYCQSRLRVRGLSISLLIFVLLAAFIVALVSTIGTGMNQDPVDSARIAILPLLLLQDLVLFIFGTAQVAGGMTAERDEGVIDYQRLIPMSPLAKMVGYLFGLPVREWLIFFAIFPFSLWSFWRGEVPISVWGPLYLVMFSSAVLYHITGLVTGMVVRNRRWAFLISIGLVFALYTVIPQMAKFGLVFFKYLTVFPVLEESLPRLMPHTAGQVLSELERLAPTVKFFNLNFSEIVFTLFSQGGLILTFGIMVWRRWRRNESHLLGKAWATGFFAWVQLLFLGNALPLIDPGNLFPSRAFMRMARLNWRPDPSEAAAMCGIYGLVTLGLIFTLASTITPSLENQTRGWRRTRKMGRTRLGFFEDAATAFWFVALMAIAGAGGWFIFTSALVESRWFPGHTVPASTFLYFAAVMLSAGIGYQALLESKGGRTVGFTAIFVGIVPLMAGIVLGPISERMIPIAAWIAAISPLSMPAYAAASLLSVAPQTEYTMRAVPRAFHFWLIVSLIVMVWLVLRLRLARRRLAAGAATALSPLPEQAA
jgi:hypothetical protein